MVAALPEEEADKPTEVAVSAASADYHSHSSRTKQIVPEVDEGQQVLLVLRQAIEDCMRRRQVEPDQQMKLQPSKQNNPAVLVVLEEAQAEAEADEACRKGRQRKGFYSWLKAKMSNA